MESKKSFFPLFIDLNGRECLIVGGGNVAYRKSKKLLEYGAKIHVIASEIKKEFYELDITIEKREFRVGDILRKFLVVAATDNEILNEMIVDLCENNDILVNNITSKDYMSARFSSNYENNEYQIAVSAKGNPKKAIELRNKITEIIENKRAK